MLPFVTHIFPLLIPPLLLRSRASPLIHLSALLSAYNIICIVYEYNLDLKMLIRVLIAITVFYNCDHDFITIAHIVFPYRSLLQSLS